MIIKNWTSITTLKVIGFTQFKKKIPSENMLPVLREPDRNVLPSFLLLLPGYGLACRPPIWEYLVFVSPPFLNEPPADPERVLSFHYNSEARVQRGRTAPAFIFMTRKPGEDSYRFGDRATLSCMSTLQNWSANVCEKTLIFFLETLLSLGRKNRRNKIKFMDLSPSVSHPVHKKTVTKSTFPITQI